MRKFFRRLNRTFMDAEVYTLQTKINKYSDLQICTIKDWRKYFVHQENHFSNV